MVYSIVLQFFNVLTTLDMQFFSYQLLHKHNLIYVYGAFISFPLLFLPYILKHIPLKKGITLYNMFHCLQTSNIPSCGAILFICAIFIGRDIFCTDN